MIGGLIDGLMGKVNFRAQAPQINTAPGQRAIAMQARQGGQQALAQSYAMANSGRGGGANQALALREAQRRGAEATANLNTQAVAQQQALQQSANQQQAQGEMQAQQINAGIAQQEAGGMKQLVSAGLLAGALMSDYRQKEMLSDFETKEPIGQPNLYEAALARARSDPRPIAQYQPQQVRPGVTADQLSNQAVATHLRDRGEQLDIAALQDPNEQAIAQQNLQDQRMRAAALMQQKDTSTQDGLMGIASLLNSDFTQKEMLKARAGSGSTFDLSPERIHRMGDYEINEARKRYRDSEKRRNEFDRLRYIRQEDVPSIERSRTAMISDFQQKEDLDPVRPTLYRYKPESSYRQALEAAQQTFAQAYEDKRAPREGIVAQDLQRSPAFAPSVVEKPDGQLAIDRDRALSTALAELGGLHQRMKRLEAKRGA